MLIHERAQRKKKLCLMACLIVAIAVGFVPAYAGAVNDLLISILAGLFSPVSGFFNAFFNRSVISTNSFFLSFRSA